MKKTAVTIVDIANELRLSKTTVSDALIGSGRVSESTRRRVAEVAGRMGYVSNRAARHLRGSQTGSIGLYVPKQVRNLAFYMEFAFGAADQASLAEYDLTLFGREPKAHASFPVDAAIAVDPLPGDPMLERLLAAKFPLVTAGRLLGNDRATGTAGTDVPAGVIEIDHRRTTTEILDGLAHIGVRRPAFLAPDSRFGSSFTVDTIGAYRSWCADRNTEPLTLPLTVTPTDSELFIAVRTLIGDSGVDGLVCAAQGLAGRAAVFLPQLGQELGRSIQLASLVGDPVTELRNPAISSVDLRPREFGENAVDFLLEILNGTTPPSPHRRENAEVRLAEGHSHSELK
ncbi:LacI family DNA-binding transcriptional regulator [Saxibacter everestensis]|uniref:LacI family DNA-binding transcriptional regulator n=1 Tax=Saxibacter everestensis TaxID=2909229 RepID=A0ABY8QSZ2_9MICO|nr:LacI family DNA-binding transcriptional regulator [Brevibacteriaceae bacterium ZFBP1038]